MNYDEFKQAWGRALRESRLPILGATDGEETVDFRSMDRTFTTHVEPVGGQEMEPFHVTATLSWRWNCLLTARTTTTEEDLLSELLGRQGAHGIDTERPWLRVDVKISASLSHGKAIPMPTSAVWAKWTREAYGRLERIEPLVPDEDVREGRQGGLEILAWQGAPTAKVTCGVDGNLKLERVDISAWQAIELPRQWDDSDREPDEHPARQLDEMFNRARAALHAWMQVVDHLAARNTP